VDLRVRQHAVPGADSDGSRGVRGSARAGKRIVLRETRRRPLVPDVDAVVERNDRYWVVQKIGVAAKIAEDATGGAYLPATVSPEGVSAPGLTSRSSSRRVRSTIFSRSATSCTSTGLSAAWKASRAVEHAAWRVRSMLTCCRKSASMAPM
jgi:hypothetical protein